MLLKGGPPPKKQDKPKKVLSDETKEKRKAKFEALKMKKKGLLVKESKLRDPKIEFMEGEEQAKTVWEMYKVFAGKYKFPPQQHTHTLTKDQIFTLPDNALPYTHTIGQFSKALTQFVPEWQQLQERTKIKASPTLLVITPAALRAVDIIKQINYAFKKSVKVTKLFARHIHVNEQASILTSFDCRAAVGTPHRLGKLNEMGALSLEHTKYLLIDAGRNDKNMSIFSMPQVNQDFFLFFHRCVLPRLGGPYPLRICFV